MKTFLFPKTLLMVVALTVLTISLHAAGYYVVIASFEKESNAREFVAEVRHTFEDASYSYDKSRKMYYVHVFKTSRKEEAQKWTAVLRNEKGFKEAWVLADAGSDAAFALQGARSHQMARYGGVSAGFGDGLVLTSAAPDGNTARYEANDAASVARESWVKAETVSYLRGAARRPDVFSNDGLKSQAFTFVIEDPDGKEMPGEVSLVNFEKSKVIASFRPGEQVSIRGTRREQMVAFVCEELGYAMESRFYNIDHLSRGQNIRKNAQGVWEVRIKLKRMELYDQAILYKTKFHKDEAILEASSTGELNELVKVMKANPTYEIVLHSHCNKGGRHLIALPSEGNASGQHVSRVRKGSDRMLTRARAKVIRDYLVENGVAMERVDIVGWGSREMLVNPTGEDVGLNERVEVELVGR
jgi:outer membrane protein OmpA-like peptidoglycan-associated protein